MILEVLLVVGLIFFKMTLEDKYQRKILRKKYDVKFSFRPSLVELHLDDVLEVSPGGWSWISFLRNLYRYK